MQVGAIPNGPELDVIVPPEGLPRLCGGEVREVPDLVRPLLLFGKEAQRIAADMLPAALSIGVAGPGPQIHEPELPVRLGARRP